MQSFTAEEVLKHDSPDDVWVVVNKKVYDVTKFYRSHPGGEHVIRRIAGRDATRFFRRGPHGDMERNYLETFFIGNFEGDLAMIAPPKGCVIS